MRMTSPKRMPGKKERPYSQTYTHTCHTKSKYKKRKGRKNKLGKRKSANHDVDDGGGDE